MLLQDKIAWRTYSIDRVIQDLKNAITFNNKSIFGSKFWNKVFLQSPCTLLYMIQKKKVQARFKFRTPTKTTQSVPSPNANKSLFCSLPKQNNCYLGSNPSLQLLVIQSLKTATNTHWCRFTFTHCKVIHTALFPCIYTCFKYTSMPPEIPEIPLLLDLKKPVTTYYWNFTTVRRTGFQDIIMTQCSQSAT